MSHLLSYRKGWQSEHLARYILSKFSFIAEPNNISDDIGSDFFCTIFSVYNKKYLLANNSIAIQIKSDKRRIDISGKLEYLMNIEIPYFVGVVNKKTQEITLYSGEAIPHFFSKNGNPSILPNKPKTYIQLVETRDNGNLFNQISENEYVMNFPKLFIFRSDFNYEQEIDSINQLKDIVAKMQKNISSKKSNEYLFDFIDNTGVAVYAGSGSASTYKVNVCKRLCEAFFNIEYISNATMNLKVQEFRIYEQFFNSLQAEYGELPQYLVQIYNDVRTRLNL